MVACEPCWNEAYRQSRLTGRSQVECYQRLLKVLDGHPHDEPSDRRNTPAQDPCACGSRGTYSLNPAEVVVHTSGRCYVADRIDAEGGE